MKSIDSNRSLYTGMLDEIDWCCNEKGQFQKAQSLSQKLLLSKNQRKNQLRIM